MDRDVGPLAHRPGQSLPASVQREVFRPGIGQYIYLGWAPALVALAGLAIIAAALEPQAEDRIALIAVGLAIASCGGLLLAYIFGMSIEVQMESVRKVYLFGLVHVAIPLKYFSASAATEHQSGTLFEWSYTRLDFEASDDVGDGFGAYPFWVWRRRDMDRLLALAQSMSEWRATHPMPARAEPPPTFWGFLKFALLMTWVGGLLAIVPLVLVYTRWGGMPTLIVAIVLEAVFIGLSARVTWGPRSAPDRGKASPSGGVYVAQGLAAAPSDLAAVPFLEFAHSREIAHAPERPEPSEIGWAYFLGFVSFVMLAIGIWSATQSHVWTRLWPLNVIGGLMSYIPMGLVLRFGDRLPKRPLFRWTARGVALILTVAIPFIVWGPVPPPPS